MSSIGNLQELKFKSLENIPLSSIIVSENNVRKTKLRVGIDELKISIENVGLLEPIVVEKIADSKYELIVGQRRFLAFQELKRKTIPAVIIDRVNEETAKLASFGENAHRRALPFNDTIQVCEYLFDRYSKNKSEKMNAIKKIAIDLGITPETVARYLAYKLIPEEVRNMVNNNEIGRDKAYKITSAFWPNTKRIIDAAKYVTTMTGPEWDRFLSIHKEETDIDIEKAVEKAKTTVMAKIEIVVDQSTFKLLKNLAKEQDMDIPDFIRAVVEERLALEK